MHQDEYVARLRIQRRHFSEILGKVNTKNRLQQDQLIVQEELHRLMDDPNADKREIERCKAWLRKYGPETSYTPVQLTPRQRTTKMLLGSIAPKPVGRRDKRGNLSRFLGDF